MLKRLEVFFFTAVRTEAANLIVDPVEDGIDSRPRPAGRMRAGKGPATAPAICQEVAREGLV